MIILLIRIPAEDIKVPAKGIRIPVESSLNQQSHLGTNVIIQNTSQQDVQNTSQDTPRTHASEPNARQEREAKHHLKFESN